MKKREREYTFPLGTFGLRQPFKGFETGEVIKALTKRNKLRERPGITITHIQHKVLNSMRGIVMMN